MITSGSAAGLEYDLAHRDGVGDGSTVAVLLHGRGSHKGDLQALAPVLPPDWTLVTPQAPFPGSSWGYGPGWAWYRYVEEDRLVTDTLEQSLSLLDDFLDGLADVVGFVPARIVLGGFSQGGTTSLAFALSRPGLLAGALNFSGFLAAHLDVPHGEAAAGAAPIFWGHGVRDANIPILLAERGRTRLRDAGVPLVTRDYPIGHWMVPEEVHEAVALVETQTG
jgi:phospholipase/carboxylesterase